VTTGVAGATGATGAADSAGSAYRAGRVEHVLVVGGGAIGSSWAAHFLLHGLRVTVVDPDPAVRAVVAQRAVALVGEVEPARTRTAGTALAVSQHPEPAAAATDLVVECGPEREDVKQDLFARLDRAAPPDVLLTSSSSGLLPSALQAACGLHPERVLVAHPFNPPHLLPLVELVGGARTATAALDAAETIFSGVGKRVVRVHGERPGHVVNRLQAALWREAYHLVAEGAVSVADVDTALAWGPGLRWALLGPFVTQHLSGGDGGIEHVLAHLGPPMAQWWDDLGTPTLTPELVRAVVAGVADAVGDTDLTALRARRDAALQDLVRLKGEAGLDPTAAPPVPDTPADR